MFVYYLQYWGLEHLGVSRFKRFITCSENDMYNIKFSVVAVNDCASLFEARVR